MICRRCLHAARRAQGPQHATRYLSISAARPSTPISASTAQQSTPRPAPRGTHDGPPAATSTSAAQPFSTPLTPSPPKMKKPSSTNPKLPRSSIQAGTVLRGLNLLKGKVDPVAKDDHEYPPWLWNLLVDGRASGEGGDGAGGEDGGGDLYAKSPAARRKAAKALRKREAAMGAGGAMARVPVEEQSVDLPTGPGRFPDAAANKRGAAELTAEELALRANVAAAGPRKEITKAMRDKRRAKIKESNFLKSVS